MYREFYKCPVYVGQDDLLLTTPSLCLLFGFHLVFIAFKLLVTWFVGFCWLVFTTTSLLFKPVLSICPVSACPEEDGGVWHYQNLGFFNVKNSFDAQLITQIFYL